jgi:hypothetical protein
MSLLQIRMGEDQPVVDNLNFLDCLNPEEVVSTQIVLDMLGVNYERCGLKERDKVVLRYYTDVNLTDGVRNELELMKRTALSRLKEAPDNLSKLVEQAQKAFDGIERFG